MENPLQYIPLKQMWTNKLLSRRDKFSLLKRQLQNAENLENQS